MTPELTHSRRWLRFRLWTLLIVVAVIAIPLAWIAKERRQAGHERQVASELQKLGYQITFGGVNDSKELRDNGEPQGWRSDLIRRALGGRVLCVLSDDTVRDDLTRLADFPNLQELCLKGVRTNNLAPLAGLADLEVLFILSDRDRGITPFSDLHPIAGLTKLRELTLSSDEVRDIAPIAGLVNLEFLQLSGAGISDISPLAGMKEVQLLDLANTQVRDLSPLAGLTSLEGLELTETPVSNLAPLAGLTNLRNLWITNTSVTKEQVEALQGVLPNCQIFYDPFP
jgi:Leucine-rich repeat (LRR) protein